MIPFYFFFFFSFFFYSLIAFLSDRERDRIIFTRIDHTLCVLRRARRDFDAHNKPVSGK